LTPETVEQFRYHTVAGWGGFPLVGTAEQIVEELGWLSRAGVDGCLLSWPVYGEGLAQWNREVMPLMEQAGLRQPPRARDV
jgi:alkanesulfonate monooxygenase SsuD/methylene tetrahydromethanopterin reductase-like flavin-dependent oxidoreductase (luciferase family)